MARKPEPLPDSFDPLEIALDAERGDGAADSPARTLLVKHNALADADLRHRALQIASERAGMLLKVLTAAAGLAAAAVLVVLAWQAHDAHGLVVEPFSTPPDLAAKGLTGQAVAARFLDCLRDMQARTDSARAPSSYGNDWASGFKVEIPGAGISLDDLQRFLRGWLGHETHVSGEVSRTADGLLLSVRAGDGVGQTYAAKGDDVDGLLQQAALGLYKDQQPYRYAIYLRGVGRNDEALAVLRNLAYFGPIEEQPFALAGLSNFSCVYVHDCRTAILYARRALEIDPTGQKPLWNLSDSYAALLVPEQILSINRQLLAKGHDPKIAPDAEAVVKQGSRAVIHELLGDFAAAAADHERQLSMIEYSGNRRASIPQRLDDLIWAHDLTRYDASRRFYAPVLTDPAELSDLDFERAVSLEDWRTVADWPLPPPPGLWAGSPGLASRLYRITRVAVAKAHLGDVAGAEALIGPTDQDCYDCLMARGDIAALKGDRGGADRWFAEALRQAPSIPMAYVRWGQVKLARGEVAGAAALFAMAAAKAPRYADASSAWGEALLRQGDLRGAADKLRKAALLAPNWGHNQVVLGEALMRLGKTAEAQAQWLAARGQPLSAGDHARLNNLLAGAR
jgi:tetratricopeptide (TPR) repeat protein